MDRAVTEDVTTEELAEWVRDIKEQRRLPVYEWYVTMFSISLSVILFLFEGMLTHTGSNVTNLYDIMLNIMPQYMWAFAFLGAGLIKAVGLLVSHDALRILGLTMSVVLYTVMTVCYALNFPTIGAITFGWMTVFSVVSLFMVKHTG